MITYIEQNIKTISDNDDVTDMLNAKRKRIEEKIETFPNIEELKFEVFALQFVLSNGKVEPCITMGNYNHPTFEKFGDIGIEYIKKRATETSNKYLSARYNQVVYNHPGTKHNSFLKNAIKSYLSIIEDLISEKKIEHNYELDLVFQNFIYLGAESKSNHKIVKDEVQRLLSINTLPIKVKMAIFQIMLEVKQIFSQSVLKSYIGVWNTIYDSTNEEKDAYTKRSYAEVGLNLAERTEGDVKPWYEEIGDTHRIDTLAEISNDSRILITVMFCDNAIRAYKKAGADSKVKEMRIIREDLKDRFELPEFQLEIEIEKDMVLNVSNHKHELCQKLFEMDANQMYQKMTAGVGLFPRIDDLMKNAKDRKSFMELFTTSYYDTNNNKVTDSTNEDNKVKKFYESYDFHVNFLIRPILNGVFEAGVYNKKINYENLISFLQEHTWMGKVPMRSSKKCTSSWVTMTAPAFNEYFAQMEYTFLYPDYNMQTVLILDSLTTKFEGAFRQLCKLHGIIVTTETKEGQRQKFLHELIYEESILEILGKDDIIFFRYLYTKYGLDLRNRIAHSFMEYQDYSIGSVHLVMMSFLRLAKYDLTPKNQ